MTNFFNQRVTILHILSQAIIQLLNIAYILDMDHLKIVF
jgi:hypothetical protein